MSRDHWTRLNVLRAMEAWQRAELEVDEVIDRVIELLLREGVVTQPVPPDQRLGPAAPG